MNMKLRNIPFSPPDMSDAEIEMVADALRSGWITTGPKTKEFEQLIAICCGTEKAVCLNSATACMESILRALGVGPGDEVITSAYTYTATASVTCHVGAKVVMVDTKPGSFEMDYDKMAHAFGARRNGKMCGAIADFTSFSFHAVKNLTTAEGGALTWVNREGLDNNTLYKQFQLLSLHGQNKDALAKTQLGAWEYDIIAPFYKCNMTDVMSGIGLAQLKRYPEMLRRRREIIGLYNEGVKGTCIIPLNHYPDNDEGTSSSGHLYICRLEGKTIEERNAIIIKMAERGIACNVHYKPLPMMTAYKALGFDIKDYPNAYEMYHNEITLPLHTRLTDNDVAYVIENFVDIVKSH